jgi:hypothetical protein
MRKVYTFVEFVFALLLIAFGIFIFDSGFFGSPRDSMIVLPLGAVFLASGCMILALAIRSRIWHRRMLRERPLEGAGPMSGLSHHS